MISGSTQTICWYITRKRKHLNFLSMVKYIQLEKCCCAEETIHLLWTGHYELIHKQSSHT